MNKKVSNSQQRLVELMDYYKLNQTELCKRTGLLKSALSNYLKGEREPRQDQISLIADPFNINPAWLMGYDVPMFLPLDTPEAKKIREDYVNDTLSSDDRELLDLYHIASPEVKAMVDFALRGIKHNP